MADDAATGTDRWKALDFGPPHRRRRARADPVLLDYDADGRVAVITLNRPHADNAITTEMGARLTEVARVDRRSHRGSRRDHHRRR